MNWELDQRVKPYPLKHIPNTKGVCLFCHKKIEDVNEICKRRVETEAFFNRPENKQ